MSMNMARKQNMTMVETIWEVARRRRAKIFKFLQVKIKREETTAVMMRAKKETSHLKTFLKESLRVKCSVWSRSKTQASS